MDKLLFHRGIISELAIAPRKWNLGQHFLACISVSLLTCPSFLEIDCSSVASVFGKDCFDRSPLIDLKKEAVNVSKLLVKFQISKINRRDNTMAHEIAKFSFISRSDGLLVNSVPPCVVYAVMTDCNNLLFN